MTSRSIDIAASRGESVAEPTVYCLDPTDMAAGRAPVAAGWPVARQEIVAAFDAAVAGYAALARRYETDEPETAELLSMNMTLVLIAEWLSVFHAHAVIRRARAEGGDVLPPAGSRIYRALLAGEAPAPPPWIANLVDVPWRKQGPRVLLRAVRDRLARRRVPIRPMWATDLGHTPVLTIRTPLAMAHAASIPEPVVFGTRDTWYRPIPHGELQAQRSRIETHAVLDEVTDIMRRGCRAGGEELPEHLAAYLRNVFAATAAACAVHYDRLAARRLPKLLWTGSGGNIWDRILRHAVRRRDGRVIGHDHGPGAGYRVPDTKPFGDYIACDLFVTYTDAQVAGLRKSCRPAMTPTAHLPKIVSLDEAVRRGGGDAAARVPVWKPAPPAAPTERAAGRPTIMYVAYGYDGERTRPIPKPPAPMAIEWQRRLFARLGEWGYDVVFKFHPELHLPESTIETLLGVRAVGGHLDAAMAEADILLMEWATSTSLCAAVRSGKPIVFNDMGFVDITDDARRLMQRRIAFVDGGVDADGRMDVDWQALQEALVRSPDLMDGTFAETYLGR